MNRLAPHIEPGFRFRRGMEGDPLYPFDNPEQAPCGTVEQVFRGDNGSIRFQGRMDGTGSLEEFTNVTADPSEVWEMDPQYADAFRRQREEGRETRVTDDYASYRGEVEDRFRALDARLSTLADQYADFRSTFAAAMLEVTKDVRAVQNGEPPSFSGAVGVRAETEGVHLGGLEEGGSAHPDDDVASRVPADDVASRLPDDDVASRLPDDDVASRVPADDVASSRHDFAISRGAKSRGADTKSNSRHDFPAAELKLEAQSDDVTPLKFNQV
jgi:hypothetical protein